MKFNVRPVIGVILGGVIGLGSVIALGAGVPSRPFPRHTVVISQGALVITDNDTDTLYLYETSSDPAQPTRGLRFRLHGVLDMSQAGQAVLAPMNGEQ